MKNSMSSALSLIAATSTAFRSDMISRAIGKSEILRSWQQSYLSHLFWRGRMKIAVNRSSIPPYVNSSETRWSSLLIFSLGRDVLTRYVFEHISSLHWRHIQKLTKIPTPTIETFLCRCTASSICRPSSPLYSICRLFYYSMRACPLLPLTSRCLFSFR